MLASSSAVIMALVLGTILASWQATVATRERRETERQRQVAQVGKMTVLLARGEVAQSIVSLGPHGARPDQPDQ